MVWWFVLKSSFISTSVGYFSFLTPRKRALMWSSLTFSLLNINANILLCFLCCGSGFLGTLSVGKLLYNRYVRQTFALTQLKIGYSTMPSKG